jgi:hypothetical protein
LSNKSHACDGQKRFENDKENKGNDLNTPTIKIFNYNSKNDNIETADETLGRNSKNFLDCNKKNSGENNKIKNLSTISVKRSIAGQIEPRFKIVEFQKLAPKFLKSAENSVTVSQILNQDTYINDNELLEIDEKLPQEKLNQIKERINKLNIYKNFPFNYFFDKEKCYEELSKDFKSNGIKNLDYKIKIGASYLNILMKEDNPISKLFIYKKEINKFLIRELCFYLIVLFLNDFQSGLKSSDLSELSNCVTFCHLNYLFVLMLIIKNTGDNIFEHLSEIDKSDDFCYTSYLKCKTIVELNQEKIDEIQIKKNFHNYNKIIKSILYNLLRDLSFVNNIIAENILKIFYCSKEYLLSDVIDDFLKGNDLLNQKLNRIIRDSIKPKINRT